VVRTLSELSARIGSLSAFLLARPSTRRTASCFRAVTMDMKKVRGSLEMVPRANAIFSMAYVALADFHPQDVAFFLRIKSYP
jgi:hypothetical protein